MSGRSRKDEDDEMNDDILELSSRKKKNVDSLLDSAKKADDPLLGALSLVLAANYDYAKSVSSLLSTDLSQTQSLTEIKEKLNSLIEKTDELLTSQESLLTKLDDLPEVHHALIKKTLAAQSEKDRVFLTSNFSKLFIAAGLKQDGNEHGEADKLVRTLKYLFSKQVVSVIVGTIAYNLSVWLLKYFTAIRR